MSLELVTISSSSSDAKYIGIIQKISDLLEKRQGRLKMYLSKIDYYIFFLYISIPPMIFGFTLEEVMSYVEPFFLYVWLMLLIIAYLLYMYKNKIYLYERSNKNNFFIKNKDQLLTGIISAILGGLAVLFVQYIVDYFR